MSNNRIPIPGPLYSADTGNKVTTTNYIFDEEINKNQEQINSEILEALDRLNDGENSDVYSKNEVDALINSIGDELTNINQDLSNEITARENAINNLPNYSTIRENLNDEIARATESEESLSSDIIAINNKFSKGTVVKFDGFVNNSSINNSSVNNSNPYVYFIRSKNVFGASNKLILNGTLGTGPSLYSDWPEGDLYNAPTVPKQPYDSKIYICDEILYIWNGSELKAIGEDNSTPTIITTEGTIPEINLNQLDTLRAITDGSTYYTVIDSIDNINYKVGNLFLLEGSGTTQILFTKLKLNDDDLLSNEYDVNKVYTYVRTYNTRWPSWQKITVDATQVLSLVAEKNQEEINIILSSILNFEKGNIKNNSIPTNALKGQISENSLPNLNTVVSNLAIIENLKTDIANLQNQLNFTNSKVEKLGNLQDSIWKEAPYEGLFIVDELGFIGASFTKKYGGIGFDSRENYLYAQPYAKEHYVPSTSYASSNATKYYYIGDYALLDNNNDLIEALEGDEWHNVDGWWLLKRNGASNYLTYVNIPVDLNYEFGNGRQFVIASADFSNSELGRIDVSELIVGLNIPTDEVITINDLDYYQADKRNNIYYGDCLYILLGLGSNALIEDLEIEADSNTDCINVLPVIEDQEISNLYYIPLKISKTFNGNIGYFDLIIRNKENKVTKKLSNIGVSYSLPKVNILFGPIKATQNNLVSGIVNDQYNEWRVCTPLDNFLFDITLIIPKRVEWNNEFINNNNIYIGYTQYITQNNINLILPSTYQKEVVFKNNIFNIIKTSENYITIGFSKNYVLKAQPINGFNTNNGSSSFLYEVKPKLYADSNSNPTSNGTITIDTDNDSILIDGDINQMQGGAIEIANTSITEPKTKLVTQVESSKAPIPSSKVEYSIGYGSGDTHLEEENGEIYIVIDSPNTELKSVLINAEVPVTNSNTSMFASKEIPIENPFDLISIQITGVDTNKTYYDNSILLNISYNPLETAQTGVEWSIINNSPASITKDGLLKVSNNLRNTWVSVKATSIYNTEIFSVVDILFYTAIDEDTNSDWDAYIPGINNYLESGYKETATVDLENSLGKIDSLNIFGDVSGEYIDFDCSFNIVGHRTATYIKDGGYTRIRNFEYNSRNNYSKYNDASTGNINWLRDPDSLNAAFREEDYQVSWSVAYCDIDPSKSTIEINQDTARPLSIPRNPILPSSSSDVIEYPYFDNTGDYNGRLYLSNIDTEYHKCIVSATITRNDTSEITSSLEFYYKYLEGKYSLREATLEYVSGKNYGYDDINGFIPLISNEYTNGYKIPYTAFIPFKIVDGQKISGWDKFVEVRALDNIIVGFIDKNAYDNSHPYDTPYPVYLKEFVDRKDLVINTAAGLKQRLHIQGEGLVYMVVFILPLGIDYISLGDYLSNDPDGKYTSRNTRKELEILNNIPRMKFTGSNEPREQEISIRYSAPVYPIGGNININYNSKLFEISNDGDPDHNGKYLHVISPLGYPMDGGGIWSILEQQSVNWEWKNNEIPEHIPPVYWGIVSEIKDSKGNVVVIRDSKGNVIDTSDAYKYCSVSSTGLDFRIYDTGGDIKTVLLTCSCGTTQIYTPLYVKGGA